MKTVFLGDSITKHFDLLINHENVVNLGIGGDKINNVIGRLETLFCEKPDRVIILIGINDYLNMKNYWGSPIKINIKQMYGVLLKMIHDNLPNTEVYCVSILPVSMDIDEKTVSSYNRDIIKMNRFISQLVIPYEYTYLDLHSKFLQEDRLNPSLTTDGVHLSSAGYSLFYKLVKHIL